MLLTVLSAVDLSAVDLSVVDLSVVRFIDFFVGGFEARLGCEGL